MAVQAVGNSCDYILLKQNYILDSVFSHLAWTNTPRKEGGLGQMNIPILADTNHAISKAYGCLKEDEGIAFRGLYIIDRNGTYSFLWLVK